MLLIVFISGIQYNILDKEAWNDNSLGGMILVFSVWMLSLILQLADQL